MIILFLQFFDKEIKKLQEIFLNIQLLSILYFKVNKLKILIIFIKIL